MLKRMNAMLTNINKGPKTASTVTTPKGKNKPANPIQAGQTPIKKANADPMTPPAVFLILQTFGCLNL